MGTLKKEEIFPDGAWDIILEGDPQSQTRHRHRKLPNGKIITYDPSSADKRKTEEILSYKKPKEIYTGALKVIIVAWFRTPKYSKKRRQELENTFRPKKPDDDNIEKYYWDCMSNIVFEDDNQIVFNITQKRYSTRPRVYILVQPIEPLEHLTFEEILSW